MAISLAISTPGGGFKEVFIGDGSVLHVLAASRNAVGHVTRPMTDLANALGATVEFVVHPDVDRAYKSFVDAEPGYKPFVAADRAQKAADAEVADAKVISEEAERAVAEANADKTEADSLGAHDAGASA